MTAVVTRDDLARLRALVGQWRRADREWAVIRDLEETLAEIEARREEGPDVLNARVHGDSIPALKAAAITRAVELYGAEASLEIERVWAIDTWGGSKGRFCTTVRVRCLNYAGIGQQPSPGGAR